MPQLLIPQEIDTPIQNPAQDSGKGAGGIAGVTGKDAGLSLPELLRASELTDDRAGISEIYTEVMKAWNRAKYVRLSQQERMTLGNTARRLIAKKFIREGEKRNLLNTVLRDTR